MQIKQFYNIDLYGHIVISADLQVRLVNSSHAEVVRDVRITMNTSEEIAQLTASDDGEYIYALTASQLLREPMNPAETISINICETPSIETPSIIVYETPSISVYEIPSSTTMESPSQTDPMASDGMRNVAIIISCVVPPIFLALLVIATVALVVTRIKHRKTKQKLM